MNPTLRQMRALVALAKTGNFTLAAQYMHVTQSALSGLIKELEQTLGVRVVDRSTRRIALTETGNELYPLFSQMIDDLDRALANIADQAQLRKGIVRVAVPQLMACTLLPQVIAAWRTRYPDIRISLSDSPVEAVTTRVLSGETDFGIGPERDNAPQLEARELMEMPFEAVLPTDHALAKRRRLGWSDLATHPLITLRGQFTERLLADMGRGRSSGSGNGSGNGGAAESTAGSTGTLHEPTLRPAHEVTYMTTALAMVASGLGVTVCMPYAAPLVRLHGLRMLPLDAPVLTRRFFVYTREQRSLSPAAAAFIAFLFDWVGAAHNPAGALRPRA
ncbi:LysR family transcriptional regulator [Massilia sp. Root133]|uniref:LysR family transcriptional regulator n=1 Tax=Massilia TaxID=149698 RepID=UPI0006F69FE3|nr:MULTISPECIES: LysR family transcriptional regulator [unclassified Massilia]KQY01776.1 LysR family transcriptional regulator [Massilia sp. Root133]KQZ38736.1 LysR family transcriptional regulator [Massilia sp. Root1485]